MEMNDFYMMGQALQSFNNTLANNANVIMAANTSRQDRKFSREMSDLAWERNLEAWRMQNEYNLPANQYARQIEGLSQNGLNPNLVYGSSSSIGGAASGASPYKFEGYHTTAVPRFGTMEPIQELLSTRLLQTQVAAQEANARLINARADNEIGRHSGIVARSDEAAYRWNYIYNHLEDDYQAAVRAQVSTEYWKGVSSEYNASLVRDKSKVQYYEAVTAEWLNTSYVPGTELTYRQYLEQYKAFMPAAQFDVLKKTSLDLVSRIMYRKSQGQLLDLKKEYQGYVNRLAKFGRVLGGNWANVLMTGIMELVDYVKKNGLPEEKRPRPYDPVTRGMAEPEEVDNDFGIVGGGASW